MIIFLKTLIIKMFQKIGYSVVKFPIDTPIAPQVGGPDHNNFLSLSKIPLNLDEKLIINQFRTDRYYWLNEYRWRLLLQARVNFENKIVFEPGAGIGDQTAWLLNMGAKKVITSDGRASNVAILQKRFGDNSRVQIVQGDLENLISNSEFDGVADIVYCWGVYYHINDPLPEFPVLRKLEKIAPLLVLDYQESKSGVDYLVEYNYDNPSTSVSHSSWRQTKDTMFRAVRDVFGFAYYPIEQMSWDDPNCINDPRRIIFGSRFELTSFRLTS